MVQFFACSILVVIISVSLGKYKVDRKVQKQVDC